MCLFVGYKKPFVAKKDITVYKFVTKKDGEYVTACQGYPIKTNSLIVPSEQKNEVVTSTVRKYYINGGAIHACTFSKHESFKDEYTCLKAIIKEGTEFWVQDDFKEIAAKSLYITDEIVTDEEKTDMSIIAKTLVENAPVNKDGIHIGDVLLSDMSYASPLGDFDKSKIIAYVAAFNKNDDSPIHIAINEEYLPFLTEYDMNNSSHSNIKGDNIENDFDGYKHTYDIANANDYNSDKFKAIDYCINYSTEGTNKGDWHLGAIGEIIEVAKNVAFINAAIVVVGIGTPISINWMWSSSQVLCGGCAYSWYCYLSSGRCNGDWNCRNGKSQVRPLLAFIKQA